MTGSDTIKGIGYQNAYTLYRLMDLLDTREQIQQVAVEGTGDDIEDLTIVYTDGSEEVVQVKKRETREEVFGLWGVSDIRPIVAGLYRLFESGRNITIFRFVATGSVYARVNAIQKACQRLREDNFTPERDGRAVADVCEMIDASEAQARDFMRCLWLNVPLESEASFEDAVQNRLMREHNVPPSTVVLVHDHLYRQVLEKGKHAKPQDRIITHQELMEWIRTPSPGSTRTQQITFHSETDQATPLVFISYAKEDEKSASALHGELERSGARPWMDKKDLLAGEDWDRKIRQTVKDADFLIVCLSHRSISKRGYVQKEMKMALDITQEMPEGSIFLIPVRLEECIVPDSLSRYHYVDLFNPDGFEKVLEAISTEWNKRMQMTGGQSPGKALSERYPHLKGALGLVPELCRRCRTILLECNEFDSDVLLRDVFVTQELVPFAPGLPVTKNKAERVDVTLEYLLPKRLSDGQPVLPLFFDALSNRCSTEDAIRDALKALARDSRSELSQRLSELIEQGLVQPTNKTLRNILNALLNVEELRVVCSALDVDYDSLPGKNKRDKINELVWRLKLQHRPEELESATWALISKKIRTRSSGNLDLLHKKLEEYKEVHNILQGLQIRLASCRGSIPEFSELKELPEESEERDTWEKNMLYKIGIDWESCKRTLAELEVHATMIRVIAPPYDPKSGSGPAWYVDTAETANEIDKALHAQDVEALPELLSEFGQRVDKHLFLADQYIRETIKEIGQLF